MVLLPTALDLPPRWKVHDENRTVLDPAFREENS